MNKQAIQKHNETVLEELEEGDLIEFPRGRLYSHWAVYIGEGRVVHLAGDANDGLNANFNSGSLFTICGKQFNKAFVKIDKFWDVVLDCKAYKNNSKDRQYPPKTKKQIVEDALSMLGEIGYNVLWKNCEHFASFCRYNKETSKQVRDFTFWAGIGAAAGLATAYLLGGKKKEKE